MYALVSVDLQSEDHEEALGDVLPLLERLRATVRLVFVDVARPSLDGMSPEVVGLGDELARRDDALRRRLEALLLRVPPEQRAGVLVLAHGRAADAIVEHAPGHDLIVVCTHGRRGIERLWLGSVAERVVRSSPIPVLVARGPAPGAAAVRDERLLAAVDVDDGVEILAGEVARWALALRAPVDALFVRAPIILAPGEPMFDLGEMWASLEAEADRAARAATEAWLDCVPAPLRGVARVAKGDVPQAIVAASAGAMVVLIGTHGRRGAVRLWLGSVAERVVRLAPCTVLVLPLPR